MPQSCNKRTAAKATKGVCSAGLATTLLPATKAATICPMKIASGKFQGLIATNTPRGRKRNWLLSPVGPGSVSACPISRSASLA